MLLSKLKCLKVQGSTLVVLAWHHSLEPGSAASANHLSPSCTHSGGQLLALDLDQLRVHFPVMHPTIALDFISAKTHLPRPRTKCRHVQEMASLPV